MGGSAARRYDDDGGTGDSSYGPRGVPAELIECTTCRGQGYVYLLVSDSRTEPNGMYEKCQMCKGTGNKKCVDAARTARVRASSKGEQAVPRQASSDLSGTCLALIAADLV